ncbi:UNVERIFIED_ORG: hypothetical protein BCL66_108149 [Martelella mediterranea]
MGDRTRIAFKAEDTHSASVVADVVSILNPGTIRIGGTLAASQEHLVAGVRERAYQRCLPLAT